MTADVTSAAAGYVPWRGVIEQYREWLPPLPGTSPVITLGEGATPLLPAPVLSERTGCEVYLKVEGANPTGSFKDRGMTMAVSMAVSRGATAVICASTGNTSASAAAYAARAGLSCAVLVPRGKIALGKLAQALVHGAKLLQVDGNFDDCLELARKLAADYPVALVNSVNPDRLEGQKSAAFEIVDALGDAPDVHCLPVGNAGNISAYWMGYTQYATAGRATKTPRMLGFQASGAAPIVRGEPVRAPQTIATAIRIGNPASWGAGRGRPGRVRRPDRLGHRPADLRGVPAARGQGGGVRRAGLGRRGGRTAPGAGTGPGRAWFAGGVHGDRQRPQGPGLGGVGRPCPDHRAR